MRIFISYRRDDSRGVSGRICDRLSIAFPIVRQDVRDLTPGLKWADQLREEVASCDVCLAIIGPQWASARDAQGRPRLFEEGDWVRCEVRTALDRAIPVVPVLVHGARLPLVEALPEDLRPLLDRQSAEVLDDPYFDASVERLIGQLKRLSFPSRRLNASAKQPSLHELGLRIGDGSSTRFLPGETVGIDLGTTYSSAARLDADGNLRSISNADGDELTPSVILLEDDGLVVVGPSFERLSIARSERVVTAVKRQIGNRDFAVPYRGERLTPESLSALILKKLVVDAERTVGPIANAVISVPYYFNDARREATRMAGEIAGLNVVDIVNEPTAATLAYAWNRGDWGRSAADGTSRTVLVYDLGGGTFDVTIARYSGSKFEVIATDGDVMLGGIDWTRRLADHVADAFLKKFGDDPRLDSDANLQLIEECEYAKRILSEAPRTAVTVFFRGKALTVSVERREFERMTADLFQRTRDTTELAMRQASLSRGELDAAILVGGSSLMPQVGELVESVAGIPVDRTLAPGLAVAQGAALHAALLESKTLGANSRFEAGLQRRLGETTFADVNSHSLGVRVKPARDSKGDVNFIMIPRNTRIPHRVTKSFVTTKAGRATIAVLQGEVRDPNACSLVGTLRIDGLPPELPPGSPVEVTFEHDRSGQVRVIARELTTNRAVEAAFERGGAAPDLMLRLREALRQYRIE